MVTQMQDKIFEFIANRVQRISDDVPLPSLNESDLLQNFVAQLNLIEESDFQLMASRYFYHSDVTPHNILVWHDECSSQGLMVNVFDRETYEASEKYGKNQPHQHRFDFKTIILNGGYTHLTFKYKDGEINFEKMQVLRQGGGYSISSNEYHQVKNPLENTITIMACTNLKKEDLRKNFKISTSHSATIRKRATKALRQFI